MGANEISNIPANNGNVDPVAVWYSGCCSESVNKLQNTLMDVPQYIVRLRALILNMYCTVSDTGY
jgi:hypothetical protein